MVVFSTLRRKLLFRPDQKSNVIIGSLVKRRMAGHGGPPKMDIHPSRYQFNKCMNMIHLYSCAALVFYGGIMLYCNVFIGDAELREIPEGYVPKYWEYHGHPITRWFAWLHGDPQKYYENFLHNLYHEHWDMVYTNLEAKIKFEMKKHKDYKAYYYQAISANTYRHKKEEMDHKEQRLGMSMGPSAFPMDFKDDGDWPEEKPRGRVV